MTTLRFDCLILPLPLDAEADSLVEILIHHKGDRPRQVVLAKLVSLAAVAEHETSLGALDVVRLGVPDRDGEPLELRPAPARMTSEGACSHPGAAGPCMASVVNEGRCIWCEREMPAAPGLPGTKPRRRRPGAKRQGR